LTSKLPSIMEIINKLGYPGGPTLYDEVHVRHVLRCVECAASRQNDQNLSKGLPILCLQLKMEKKCCILLSINP
jgi:hypothetical protein